MQGGEDREWTSGGIMIVWGVLSWDGPPSGPCSWLGSLGMIDGQEGGEMSRSLVQTEGSHHVAGGLTTTVGRLKCLSKLVVALHVVNWSQTTGPLDALLGVEPD